MCFHQRLLSELGLKPSFIAQAMTTFSQHVNQTAVNGQVAAAKAQGKARSGDMYKL